MIDIESLRNILKESKIYVKENDKNFICSCPYCLDHKNKLKRGHFYVSKKDDVPVCHCWLCNQSPTINKLLFDLTGNKHEDIVTPVYNNKNYVRKTYKERTLQVPELKTEDFPYKTLYIRKRTFNQLDIHDIPNLIFDVYEFFRINGLNINTYLDMWKQDYIQNNMVCFLSKHQTLLYCRATSNDVKIKFIKIELGKEQDVDVLDYYCIDNGHYNSNVVVLSEGNFDILGCYTLDTLELNNKARVYAAGCTFSYEQLLKSVSMDFGIYKGDFYILSDNDKNKYHYKKFIENTKPLTNSLNIVYNQFGKDFGCYPQKATRIF